MDARTSGHFQSETDRPKFIYLIIILRHISIQIGAKEQLEFVVQEF